MLNESGRPPEFESDDGKILDSEQARYLLEITERINSAPCRIDKPDSVGKALWALASGGIPESLPNAYGREAEQPILSAFVLGKFSALIEPESPIQDIPESGPEPAGAA